MARARLTEEERRRRREEQQRQLEQALDELTSSDGWRRWLRTRATLHRYSFRNTVLIAHQAAMRDMEVTHVAGFRAWLKLGRCVRKGESGLSIWAPMRVRDDDAEDPEARKTIFRPSRVFDVSQTDPLPDTEPAPLAPPGADGAIEGVSHTHMIPRLERFAGQLGYRVLWAADLRGGAKGVCRRGERRREIEVLAGMSANERVAVLIHELCHALLGEDAEQLRRIGRALEEVVVESAAYVACASAGLATDLSAVPYVASWAAVGDEDPATLVREAAALIDELARRIETGLAADDEADAKASPRTGTGVAA